MKVKACSHDGKLIGYSFLCPGCEDHHVVYVNNAGRPNWTFNGDLNSPTFSPSLLVTSGHYVKGYEKEECWCTYNAAHPDDPVKFGCGICHSFIRDGKIQFLNDCTHKLAGKTVDLFEITED